MSLKVWELFVGWTSVATAEVGELPWHGVCQRGTTSAASRLCRDGAADVCISTVISSTARTPVNKYKMF